MSAKRRITDKAIKSRIFAVEHFREFNFPVERSHPKLSAEQSLHFVGGALFKVTFAQVTSNAFGQFRAFGFAGLVLVRRKERGHGRISDEAHEVDEFIGSFQSLALELGHAVVVSKTEEVLAFAQGIFHAPIDFSQKCQGLKLMTP